MQGSRLRKLSGPFGEQLLKKFKPNTIRSVASNPLCVSGCMLGLYLIVFIYFQYLCLSGCLFVGILCFCGRLVFLVVLCVCGFGR